MFIYRLCELSPYSTIRYAVNVSLNDSDLGFGPSLSQRHVPVCCILYVFHVLYTHEDLNGDPSRAATVNQIIDQLIDRNLFTNYFIIK